MSHAAIRILSMEDDPKDAARIRRCLREAFTTTGLDLRHVSDPDDFLSEVRTFRPEVILLDYMLGHSTGQELLSRLRSEESLVPVIMITGYGDEEMAAAILRAGAVDYIPKARLDGETLGRAILRALAIARYETSRRAAELRATYNETQLNVLFERMPVIGLRLDRHGGIIAINPHAAEALGWDAGAVVGQDFHDLAHRLQPDERHRDPRHCAVRQIFEDEDTSTVLDDYICRADGSFLTGQLSVDRVAGRGAGFGYIVTFDPSAKLAPWAQAEIEERMRREGRETRDLLSLVAHAIRTPLTPMRVQAQVVARSTRDPSVRRRMAVISRNCNRMSMLFDRVIDMVKIRRGEYRVEPADVSVAEIVEETRDAVAGYAMERQVDLEIDPSDEWAHVDKRILKRCLSYLMEFAIARTMPSHPVVVRVGKKDRGPAITIEDTGARLDVVQIGNLLDPLGVLLTDSVDSDQLEAALAFHTARLLVEVNGGNVDIQSQTATSVTVRLPAAKGTTPSTEAPDQATALLPGADPSPRSRS